MKLTIACSNKKKANFGHEIAVAVFNELHTRGADDSKLETILEQVRDPEIVHRLAADMVDQLADLNGIGAPRNWKASHEAICSSQSPTAQEIAIAVIGELEAVKISATRSRLLDMTTYLPTPPNAFEIAAELTRDAPLKKIAAVLPTADEISKAVLTGLPLLKCSTQTNIVQEAQKTVRDQKFVIVDLTKRIEQLQIELEKEKQNVQDHIEKIEVQNEVVDEYKKLMNKNVEHLLKDLRIEQQSIRDQIASQKEEGMFIEKEQKCVDEYALAAQRVKVKLARLLNKEDI